MTDDHATTAGTTDFFLHSIWPEANSVSPDYYCLSLTQSAATKDTGTDVNHTVQYYGLHHKLWCQSHNYKFIAQSLTDVKSSHTFGTVPKKAVSFPLAFAEEQFRKFCWNFKLTQASEDDDANYSETEFPGHHRLHFSRQSGHQVINRAALRIVFRLWTLTFSTVCNKTVPHCSTHLESSRNTVNLEEDCKIREQKKKKKCCFFLFLFLIED